VSNVSLYFEMNKS